MPLRWIRALALLAACACAREPSPDARGPGTAPPPREPLPFPDTAFQSDAAPPAGGAGGGARSRFDTQRIGGDQGTGERRYRGAPVDLDFKNADLADVFRLLA